MISPSKIILICENGKIKKNQIMNYSNSLKDPIFKIVQEASSCLNLKTYVVGGWVRDLIMNRQSKITDIDFICIGSGTTLAEEVNKKLKNPIKVKLKSIKISEQP